MEDVVMLLCHYLQQRSREENDKLIKTFRKLLQKEEPNFAEYKTFYDVIKYKYGLDLSGEEFDMICITLGGDGYVDQREFGKLLMHCLEKINQEKLKEIIPKKEKEPDFLLPRLSAFGGVRHSVVQAFGLGSVPFWMEKSSTSTSTSTKKQRKTYHVPTKKVGKNRNSDVKERKNKSSRRRKTYSINHSTLLPKLKPPSIPKRIENVNQGRKLMEECKEANKHETILLKHKKTKKKHKYK